MSCSSNCFYPLCLFALRRSGSNRTRKLWWQPQCESAPPSKLVVSDSGIPWFCQREMRLRRCRCQDGVAAAMPDRHTRLVCGSILCPSSLRTLAEIPAAPVHVDMKPFKIMRGVPFGWPPWPLCLVFVVQCWTDNTYQLNGHFLNPSVSISPKKSANLIPIKQPLGHQSWFSLMHQLVVPDMYPQALEDDML